MCAYQAKCVDIRFCCQANHFPDYAEGSEEKRATLQVRLCVLCCVGAGIVECLKGWRCVVGGWRGVVCATHPRVFRRGPGQPTLR